MLENLRAALAISVAGMSFVLGALALLWLAMALLVRLTAEAAAPPQASVETPLATRPAPTAAQRAAAVAVAVALALQRRQAPPAGWGAAPATSPWQAAVRAQTLRQRERRR